MVKKIQRRFIGITTLAITAVMLVLLLVLNIYNYGATYSEAYRILRVIADNEGEIGKAGHSQVSTDRIPYGGEPGESDFNSTIERLLNGSALIDLTGENSYMIRYYSVTFDRTGTLPPLTPAI